MDGFCVICKNTEGLLQNVKAKGFSSLLKYAKLRKDETILNHLRKKVKSDQKLTIQIHSECRKDYTNNRRLIQLTSGSRSSRRGIEFDWKKDCFICTQECIDSKKKKTKRHDWRIAKTLCGKICSKNANTALK